MIENRSIDSNSEDNRFVRFEMYDIVFQPFRGCRNESYYNNLEVILFSIGGGASTFFITVLNLLIYMAFVVNKKLRKLPCAIIIWHLMVPSDLLVGK